jgi:hypothetical protein
MNSLTLIATQIDEEQNVSLRHATMVDCLVYEPHSTRRSTER